MTRRTAVEAGWWTTVAGAALTAVAAPTAGLVALLAVAVAGVVAQVTR